MYIGCSVLLLNNINYYSPPTVSNMTYRPLCDWTPCKTLRHTHASEAHTLIKLIPAPKLEDNLRIYNQCLEPFNSILAYNVEFGPTFMTQPSELEPENVGEDPL